MERDLNEDAYRKLLASSRSGVYGRMQRLPELAFVHIQHMDGLYPWSLEVLAMRSLIVFCAAAAYQSGGWWMRRYV